MKIAYVFIPFAYNGPCISESGPKVMHFELRKYYDNKDMFQYDLELDETPRQYLNRVYQGNFTKFYEIVILPITANKRLSLSKQLNMLDLTVCFLFFK